MSTDPNEPVKTPEPALTFDAETLDAAVPAQPAAIDVNAIAAAVIAQLKAEGQAQEQQAQAQAAAAVPQSEIEAYQELVRQSRDPNDPRHANAIATLAGLRRQGEEEEWGALGCQAGHPARQLYSQSPGQFGGRPLFAFQAWENQELRRKAAEPKAEPKPKDEAGERAREARERAPGMPTRSVSPAARSRNPEFDTVDDFLAAVENDPSLHDRMDRGEVIIKHQ